MMLLFLLCSLLAVLIAGLSVPSLRERFWPALFGVGCTVALTILNLTWPDFFPMGERLRDYAMLSEVIQNPLNPQEPWFVGYPLNYYLSWYRIGALFGAIGMPPWEVYHLIGPLSMGLGMAATAVLLSRMLPNRAMAMVVTVAIWLGANPAGMVAGWQSDHNWWGPSRVVTGAINEFPAWSWLLGDVHPHYLNLAALPVALWVGWRTSSATFLLILATLLCWNYSANAWDTAPGLVVLAVAASAEFWSGRLRAQPLLQQLSLTTIATALGISAFCILSTLHLVPVETPLRFVDWSNSWIQPLAENIASGVGMVLPISILPHTQGVFGSKLSEFLMHWGFQIALVLGGVTLRIKTVREALIAIAPLLVALLIGNTALVLIALIISILGLTRAKLERHEALLVASLCIVLVPEVIFFDDPYGGENERMNTIFKFYSYAWIPFAIGAWGWWSTAISRQQIQFFGWPLSHAVAIALLATLTMPWTIQTIGDRMGSNFVTVPRERGLSHFDRTYPGSARAIQALYDMPGRGTVVEAENGAYSDGAFVATLSSKPSYLGWANHVGLLLKNPPELGRRQQIIRQIYTAPCEEKRTLMQQEQISYLVVGPNERKAFKELDGQSFNCLGTPMGDGAVVIFHLP